MSDDFRAATPRVAAGVLFRDAAGRILLVKPTYKAGWDIPGGYVEPGESPKQAAVREVREELGIERPIGRLLAIDWAPHPDEGDKLLFVFDGGELYPGTDFVIEDGEIARIEFVALDELENRLPPRLLDRLRSAATVDGDPYMEHGRRLE